MFVILLKLNVKQNLRQSSVHHTEQKLYNFNKYKSNTHTRTISKFGLELFRIKIHFLVNFW